jgi:hypothetical protein
MFRSSPAFLLALWVLLAPPAALRADDPRTLKAATDTEVAKALTEAKPGDTVILADGTYSETLVVKASGKAGQPVTIRAANARKAVFTRKGQVARIDGSFLRFEGIVFDSQYGDCTCVRAAGKRIHFLDCEIRRAGSADGKGGGDGLQFFDSSDGLVEKCLIHHCLASSGGERTDSHGIRFTHSSGMTVRGCQIDLVSGDCVQVDPNRKEWDNILIEDCKLTGGKVAANDPYPHPRYPAGTCPGENALDTKCPANAKTRPRITVRNCEVSGFRGPIGNAAAFNIKEDCEAVIDRCTISDSEIGLRLRGPARVRVTNCVLFDNDTHCRYEDRVPELHIAHCTFGRATGHGRGSFQEQRPSPDLRVVGCLFLGEKPKQAQDASNKFAEAAAFVDAAKGDYRLAAALPLSGNGPATGHAEVKVDRSGAPRPADKAPDAGAYQFRPK